MKKVIITIARQHGSGGRIIGEKLAKKLDIGYYDKQLLAMIAKESGFSEDFVQEIEEKKPSSFLYSLYMNTWAPTFYEKVLSSQSKIIHDIADRESCVIVGRCADYLLSEYKNCVKVFIHAPIEERIERVKNEYKEADERVEHYIAKKDKERASYYNFVTQDSWGQAQRFDITLNSSIGIDASVEVLEAYLRAGGYLD